MSTIETDHLLTLPEASAKSRFTVSTLRAWRLARKNIPFLKLAGRIFVRRQDLETFLSSGVVEPVEKTKRLRK